MSGPRRVTPASMPSTTTVHALCSCKPAAVADCWLLGKKADPVRPPAGPWPGGGGGARQTSSVSRSCSWVVSLRGGRPNVTWLADGAGTEVGGTTCPAGCKGTADDGTVGDGLSTLCCRASSTLNRSATCDARTAAVSQPPTSTLVRVAGEQVSRGMRLVARRAARHRGGSNGCRAVREGAGGDCKVPAAALGGTPLSHAKLRPRHRWCALGCRSSPVGLAGSEPCLQPRGPPGLRVQSTGAPGHDARRGWCEHTATPLAFQPPGWQCALGAGAGKLMMRRCCCCCCGDLLLGWLLREVGAPAPR
eukprot:701821-Pelagomonas_calceolata.AAC.5